MVVTELIAAVLVAGAFTVITERREQERADRSLRVENLRFVRQSVQAGGDLAFAGLDLRGMNLAGLDMSGADLSNANLDEAILDHAKLDRAILSGATLRNASLYCADLDDVIAYGADFSDATLVRAFLSGATLSDTTFERANLGGVKIYRLSYASNVDFDDADLSRSYIDPTALLRLDLVGATFTEGEEGDPLYMACSL